MRREKKLPDELNAVSVQSERRSATGEVTRCTRLNVRKEPASDAQVITVLNAGDRVVVNLTTKIDKYYEVLTSSGKKGYVIKTYISFIE